MPACYVFVGPSAPESEVLSVLPDATILPPVSAGDLLKLKAEPGDTVAIIDGYFLQKPAVRHKEILDLLDRGIRVLGASSMGALRAAELYPFGMEGVGRIFEMYVTGEIDGDDEVALLHLDKATGYRAATEPLVNIRYNLSRAQAEGVISEGTRQRFIHLAKELPFTMRSYRRLFAEAERAGLPAAELEALRRYLADRGENLKRLDALALLHHIRDNPRPPACAGIRLIPHTTFHLRLKEHLPVRPDQHPPVTNLEVLSLCKMGLLDYPHLHYRVALRALAALYAMELNLSAPPDQDLLAEFREQNGLGSETDYHTWLAERFLSEEELLEELRWDRWVRALLRQKQEAGTADAALEQVVAEYLCHIGLLETPDELPESLGDWLTPEERRTLPPLQCVARAAARSLQLNARYRWYAPFVRAVKRCGIFATAYHQLRRVLAFNEQVRSRYPDLDFHRIPAPVVTEWFHQRWGGQEDFRFQLLDRGFLDLADFLPLARRFYLFDKKYPGGLTLPPARWRELY